MPRSLLQLGKLFIDVLRRRRIRILAYHNVTINPADPFCVSPQEFMKQMQRLAASRIPVISLEQALQVLQQPGDVHPAVVITIDDAYADLLQHAVPVLLEHHFPATFYAVTGRIGKASDWGTSSPSYPTLNWDDLAYLSSLGFSIGSHTQTHASLPSLDDSAMQDELAMSKQLLHVRTGQRFLSLAYPYGEFGIREKTAARQSAYDCAVAFGGLLGNGKDSDVFALRREAVMNNTNLHTFRRMIFGSNDIAVFFRNRIVRRFFR